MTQYRCKWVGISGLVLIFSVSLYAENWPTFRHDYQRSGATSARLQAAALKLAWVYKSVYPPVPAWHGPAKWDAYAKIPNLRSMRNYDAVFHPIIVKQRVYFGSSSDDSVHCLNLADGRELWCFVTDAPVRIAPTFSNGRLYFGSDDGYAYCIDAERGNLIWKYSPKPDSRLIINNSRFISQWPVRTGVVVDKGIAYFANSLLPWKHSYLTAVDAVTGKVIFQREFKQIIAKGMITMEGPFSVSSNYLISPRGRMSPLLFDRKDGKYEGLLNTGTGQLGRGGAFVVLCENDIACYGPGNKNWSIDAFITTKREKILSYPNGNAITVSRDFCYIITNDSVCAYHKKTKKLAWQEGVIFPCELILADDVLFVGSKGNVTAFHALDGKKLWHANVDGKAYGLAAANETLIVSTDEGMIYCFKPDSENIKYATVKTISAPSISDMGLLDCWIFEKKYFSGNKFVNANISRNLPAILLGKPVFRKVGQYSALSFNGETTSICVTNDISKAKLPTKDITVTAWVKIDEPIVWGGIVGAFQDNEDFERGWLLGYSNSGFYFKLKSERDSGKFVSLFSRDAFKMGYWYHVAGTYDGNVMKLYVNGKEVASSSQAQGNILYPPSAFYEIGAYHDKDEYNRLKGAINEIRVYEQALSAEKISKLFEDKAKGFPQIVHTKQEFYDVAVGPYLQFIDYDKAVVRWQTRKPCATILEYYDAGDVNRKIISKIDNIRKREHRVVIEGLERNNLYKYYVITEIAGKKKRTKDFDIDTFFNFVPQPIKGKPSDIYKTQAKNILSIAKIYPSRGICIVFDSGRNGELAYELARQSQFYVVGVDDSLKKVCLVRKNLVGKRLYGNRLTFRYITDVEKLPFTGNIATLIVNNRSLNNNKAAEEIYRVLQPNGGMAIMYNIKQKQKYKIIRKSPLASAGVWTHMYGRADNSTYGGETLSGAKKTNDMMIQWIGRPGPKFHSDRNGRPSSPLAINGRLFFHGLDRIAGIDAYNGTILWSLEIPEMMRFNIPRDCGFWCADNDYLYLAVRNFCWKIRASDGEIKQFFPVISGPKSKWNYSWGYVAREKNFLIGSAVKRGASNTKFWGPEYKYGWANEIAYAKVCSDNLFALDASSGRPVWTYQNGVIINPTITIGDNCVYFLECRNGKILSRNNRRIADAALWKNLFFVSLDIRTGNRNWCKPLKIVSGLTAIYLAYSDDILTLVSSSSGKYYVYTYKAETGSLIWKCNFPWPYNHHGGDINRPAIVDGILYIRPKVFELKSGNEIHAKGFWGCCGTYSAYKHGLIMRRGGIISIWALPDGRTVSGWHRLRPNCWLSAIPACGMLLAPEDGGGCSCGIWMETSVGFIPKNAK